MALFALLLVLGLWAPTAIAQASPQQPSLAVTPRRPHAGAAFDVRLAGRRAAGVRVCVAGRTRTVRCARTRAGHVRLRAPRAGRWHLTARARGVSARVPLVVLPRNDRLSVLATGDSLMEAVRFGLDRVLPAGVALHSDANNGVGISNSFRFDWTEHVAATVRRWRPDVVVVFIGGNEGFPFGTVQCCTGAWVAEYARRVRADMRAYAQGGTAQVYWLTLPAPGRPTHVGTWQAENLGLRRAAAGLAPGVRLLDMGAIFTPDGTFQRSMRVAGRRTVVRTPDRIHLSYEGGVVAARAIAAAMVRDGVLLRRGR